ncbi:brain acid soluble protein 1 [Echeneis naucrates]|uniref:Brain acid soluble protein 1-like n=1 Tax=Echeneis naucrates TaxID=173247 RepID=A0A665XBQ9_ECHNA|nr:brain acid soluble protein 1-like [Echeneis naucrates]
MMSYLWILLLGSLLATSAKAQETDPEEEAAASIVTTPAGVTEAEANLEDGTDDTSKKEESNGEPGPEEKNENSEVVEGQVNAGAGHPEEENATIVTPEATPAPDHLVPEPADPTDEVEGSETPAAGDERHQTPAADDKEEATATPVEEGGLSPTVGDTEQGTPAAGDAEEPTNQEPTVFPEVVVPTADVAGKPAPTIAEGEPEDKEPEVSDPAVEDEQKEPSVPAVEEDQTVSEGGPGVRRIIPLPTVEAVVPDSEVKPAFNLEDALGEGPKEDANGANAFAAGSTEDANKPQAQEGSSNSLTGILCTVGVALVGAVTGYFTYQKKKLCFKNRQEADPEAARKADAAEANSDPQVLSNLLKSS